MRRIASFSVSTTSTLPSLSMSISLGPSKVASWLSLHRRRSLSYRFPRKARRLLLEIDSTDWFPSRAHDVETFVGPTATARGPANVASLSGPPSPPIFFAVTGRGIDRSAKTSTDRTRRSATSRCKRLSTRRGRCRLVRRRAASSLDLRHRQIRISRRFRDCRDAAGFQFTVRMQ